MSKIVWTTTEDEYGIYKSRINEFGITEKLTTYKQKWHDENPPQEPEPQPPTIEDQLAEKDRQIIELKAKQIATDQIVSENSVNQQLLLELLMEMGIL